MKFSLSQFLSNDIAIDLGTANTLVYIKSRDVILDEPSVVAVRKSDQNIVAFGRAAKEMVGRTPGEIITIRPLKDGVIADFDLSEQMIRYFIRKAVPSRVPRPRIAICVPTGITEVEKRAVRDAAEHAGAREVYLVDEPMAAAIGLGLPVNQPVGSMIVDIGGGTTEIAVIAMFGIVNSISLRVGGDEMNEAIVQYFKKTFNLLIGDNSAEQIKCDLGSASPYEIKGSMVVKGRDLIAGIPKTITITGKQVQDALSETVTQIADALKMCLEMTPPELSADILDRGILMTGGGSMLKGLDERLRQETNLPVIVAEEPLLAVVRGTGKVLDDLNRYRKVITRIKKY
ncbi:MAG TPA: rod shape-determining protein [bacterium]|nr:rod shape-determining protein [bacterium]HNT64864.1 rod shape-determining protein [bacterium]HOX84968.1 rod shape-determining protein [bacterium]HPG44166.1 rod shape-determining protein [bacterium]HPM96533.1 rod shape-determining protein [bacterium]